MTKADGTDLDQDLEHFMGNLLAASPHMVLQCFMGSLGGKQTYEGIINIHKILCGKWNLIDIY